MWIAFCAGMAVGAIAVGFVMWFAASQIPPYNW